MKNQSILYPPRISDTATFAASQYIATGLSFLTTIFTARILGPADYGVVVLIMSYPLLLWSLMGIKSSSVTIRYISDFRASGRTEEIKSICKLGYGLDFFISVVTFILVSATSWWVAKHILHMSFEKSWFMIIFAASFLLLSLTDTSWAVLSSWARWRWLAALHILEKIITLVIVFGILWSGLRVWGVILGMAVGNIIFGLLMITAATYILYRDGIGLWWKATFSRIMSIRKELIAFFGWNYLMMSLNGLVGQVPLMLLGYLEGPKEAGYYRLITSLAMVGSYLESSGAKTVYPILSIHWNKGERNNLKSTLLRWTLWRGLPVGVLLLLTIPLLKFIIPLVFGSGYGRMVMGTQVMMVGVVVSTIFFWLMPFYYASGRIGLWTKGYAIYTAIVIVLGWFCIRQGGFVGLAILITVTKVAFTLIMALGLKESPLRISKYKPPFRDNHKLACFTFWFPNHNNVRHTPLFPKLASSIRFYKVAFSRQRFIRVLQYHLWMVFKTRCIYPLIFKILSRRHQELFCVDVQQIRCWPRKKSVVVDIDDPVFSPAEIELLNLPQVKAIIVTMERMKEIFQQMGVVRPIYIIPQGVSMEHIDSSKTERIRVQFKGENDLVVGYHAPTLTLSCDGPWRARQGMDDLGFLLAAVANARKVEPHIKLWLFGEASKSLKKYVAQRHESWVKFFGYIPYSDILNYLSNFDIAVYPRAKRGPVRFREKIAEYMACGIPIVSTNVEEGPMIVIKQAGCGVICDSQEDFTKTLVMLAHSSEMRQELGRAGQRYAVANLDWSILAQRYKQILSQA